MYLKGAFIVKGAKAIVEWSKKLHLVKFKKLSKIIFE
jgi:hypothetical protein